MATSWFSVSGPDVRDQLFCHVDDITLLFLFNKEKLAWPRIASRNRIQSTFHYGPQILGYYKMIAPKLKVNR